MELYFTETNNISESDAVFDSFESRHVLKTMRRKIGDSIHFTDGQGRLFIGQIAATNPVLRVKYQLVTEEQWPPPALSILGIGFIRHTRMDFMIEKTTELGINKFYLFASQYTNYFTRNSSRWEKITRQAIKQSNRLCLPEINISPDFKSFLGDVSFVKYKFLADQSAAQGLPEVLKNIPPPLNNSIIFLIGPEGGLAKEERELAQEAGFLPLCLCEHILRTETAAISAASYINLLKN
jgi:16S rRNA (uracil1498-N3)-methyltransferase